MRIIEFRARQAFGTMAGRWLYGSLVLTTDQTSIEDGYGAQIHTQNEGDIYVLMETVGQFTGCEDKHLAPIFEGDLYKLPFYGTEVVEVTFSNGSFMCNPDGYRYSEGGEIVGNIHEAKS